MTETSFKCHLALRALVRNDRVVYMAAPLLFLLKLAWESRYRIPLIITIGFMALDIRMQLEINVQMRRIRRARTPPAPQVDDINLPNQHDSDGSSDSWLTLEEEEIEDGEIGVVVPDDLAQ